MQQAAGLDVRWVYAGRGRRPEPDPEPGRASRRQLPRDGRPHRPAAQRPRLLARDAARRRRAARAHRVHRPPDRAAPRRRVTGRRRSRRTTGRSRRSGCCSPAVPALRAVGRLAGIRIPAGAVRHTVAVLEPHEAFAVERQPMVFDIGAGLYWRLEEGGLLFGWSDPSDRPGEARDIDWAMYEAMRDRLAGFVPVDPGTRPPEDLGRDDRLHARPPADPRAGPVGGRRADRGRDDRLGGRPRDDVGTGRGARRGGPGYAGRRTSSTSRDLGLDRFDAAGRSRLRDRSDRAAVPGRRRGRRAARRPDGSRLTAGARIRPADRRGGQAGDPALRRTGRTRAATAALNRDRAERRGVPGGNADERRPGGPPRWRGRRSRRRVAA